MSANLTPKEIVKGAAAAACNPWELAVIIPEDHPDYKLLEDFHAKQVAVMRDFWTNNFSKLTDKRIAKVYAQLPDMVRRTIEIYAREDDEEKAFEQEQREWAEYTKSSGVPAEVARELPPQIGNVIGVVAGTEYIGELTIDAERFAKK